MRKLALSVSRIFSSFFFFIKIIGALSSYGLMASFHDYEMVLHFLSKESPPFFSFFLFLLLLLGLGTIWALEQMEDFM
jgi:hypothetical protein